MNVQKEAAAIVQPQDKPMTIETVAKQISELSTLPHIAVRMIEVGNNPQSGAAELRAVVEGDPALSTKILKCVNSAAYGLRYKITTLQRAISYLGFAQVRNLAVTASVSDLFSKADAVNGYSREGLWRHMVSVAVASRMIAIRTKIEAFEETFLAGLLHDIGIIIEDQFCHECFEQIINEVAPGKSLTVIERAHCDFDHTTLGETIGERWHFPSEILSAIRYHHTPGSYRGPHQKLIACVEIANVICTLKGISSVGQNLLSAPSFSMKVLDITREDLCILAEDLDEELNRNKALFEL